VAVAPQAPPSHDGAIYPRQPAHRPSPRRVPPPWRAPGPRPGGPNVGVGGPVCSIAWDHERARATTTRGSRRTQTRRLGLAPEAGALARAALLDVEAVLAELEATHEGLSTAEAEGRLARQGTDLLILSTMVFASIALMQMAVALQCRATPASLLSIRPLSNRLLDAALLLELVALATFMYAPPVYHILGQHPLTPAQWIPILVSHGSCSPPRRSASWSPAGTPRPEHTTTLPLRRWSCRAGA
jgi:hypothetical protein